MFLDFWKLREQPFGVTPDPRYLYFSPGHREALATLFYGIETGRGFLSLVAKPGMGKTTLLFQLLRRWKGYVHSAFLFQTQCNSRELIRYLLADLGLHNEGKDIVRMHSELNDFLFRETKAGRRVVVFIDEAQNLSDPVLETVRLLSNFEAPDRKLLQIVLAGQLEFGLRLSSPGLTQLQQRIAVRARLDPLPAPEVARYVHHRLQVAGYQGPELFTPAALELVADLSGGIPRLINVLCFNALSLGCAVRGERIDAAIIREVAKESALDLPAPVPDVPSAIPRIPSRERAADVRSPVRSLWQALSSWVRVSVVRRPPVQALALSFLVGSAALYVGAHMRDVAARQSIASKSAARTAAAPEAAAPASEFPAQPRPAGVPSIPSQETPRADASSSDSVTYVVQPHDTIIDLCLSTFGRYDDDILTEIRRLNPSLTNPNHLEAGWKIRLPRNPQKRD